MAQADSDTTKHKLNSAVFARRGTRNIETAAVSCASTIAEGDRRRYLIAYGFTSKRVAVTRQLEYGRVASVACRTETPGHDTNADL
jgi:hypothetical protein